MSAISTERKWDIAVVKLDVPGKSLNILTPEVMDEIKSTFIDLNKDESVEGIVFISGKLSSFIAGVDISTVESITDPSVGTRKAAEGQAVFNLIEDMPVPVVCAINGICHGGGTELALACNYRIASDNIGGSHGEGENDLLKTSGEKDTDWLKEHFLNPSLAQPEKVVEQGKLRLDQITDLKSFYLRLGTKEKNELLAVSKEILYSASLFSIYKCGACHKIDDPEPGFGPNLAGVTLRHDRAYIYDHFLDPKKYEPTSIMPKFDWLPEEELNALTDFVFYID